MPLDWDNLHKFLAGEPLPEILALCRNPAKLEQHLQQYTSEEPMEEERADEAQLTAGWLRWKDRQAWNNLAAQTDLTPAQLEQVNGEAVWMPDSEEQANDAWHEWERSAPDRR